MANTTPTPTRGVPLEIDGTTRYLRFSLKTMRLIREKLGEDILEKGVAAQAMGDVLYLALKDSDPELTLDIVEDMIDLENMHLASAAIIAATGQRAVVETTEVEEQEGQEEPGKQPDPPTPTLVVEAQSVGEVEKDKIPSVVVGAPPIES